MRSGRAQGYSIIAGPETPTVERDTFTCHHCGCVVFVDPGKDPTTYGGWCGGCGHLICPTCEAEKARTLTCRPIERRLAEYERRMQTRRSIDALA